MNIKERLKRMNSEDVEYVGDIINVHLLQTDLISILECLIQDKNLEELNFAGDRASSDRILGRIEMGTKILTDLRNFATECENIRKPVKRNRRGKQTPLAEDPSVPDDTIRIGQI